MHREAARTALVALVVGIVEMDEGEGGSEGGCRGGFTKQRADAIMQTLDQLDCLPVRLTLQAHKVHPPNGAWCLLVRTQKHVRGRMRIARGEAQDSWRIDR